MSKSRAFLALLLVPVLFLTGCIRFVMDYEITSTEEVEIKLDFGFQNSALEAMGDDAPDDMCSDAQFANSPGATQEPYVEEGSEGYTGCRVTATITAAEASSEDVTIELVDGVWHFRQSGETEDTEGMSDEDAAQMFSDFRISVTFPGKVLTHSGSSTVKGTTVTWTSANDLMSPEGLTATAEDGGAGGFGDALVFLIIGGGLLLLVAAGVVAFVRMRRKRSTPPGPGQPGSGQSGPGQPGPGQQPWGPQPGPSGQQPPVHPPGQQPWNPGQQWGQQPPSNPGYPPQQ